jgi:hypothetical protein
LLLTFSTRDERILRPSSAFLTGDGKIATFPLERRLQIVLECSLLLLMEILQLTQIERHQRAFDGFGDFCSFAHVDGGMVSGSVLVEFTCKTMVDQYCHRSNTTWVLPHSARWTSSRPSSHPDHPLRNRSQQAFVHLLKPARTVPIRQQQSHHIGTEPRALAELADPGPCWSRLVAVKRNEISSQLATVIHLMSLTQMPSK